MELRLQFFLFLVILFILFLIIKTVKKNKLSMKYGSFWIFILILMCGAIMLPNIFNYMADFFGFETTSNMIFLVGFFFLFYIIFILTTSISKQNTKITSLIQEVSILKEENKKNGKRG